MERGLPLPTRASVLQVRPRPFHLTYHSCLLKALSPNTVPLALGLHPMNLGDTVQPITSTSPTITSIIKTATSWATQELLTAPPSTPPLPAPSPPSHLHPCLSPSRLLYQNTTDWVACKQQTFFPHHSGGWTSRTRAPAGWVLLKAVFLATGRRLLSVSLHDRGG